MVALCGTYDILRVAKPSRRQSQSYGVEAWQFGNIGIGRTNFTCRCEWRYRRNRITTRITSSGIVNALRCHSTSCISRNARRNNRKYAHSASLAIFNLCFSSSSSSSSVLLRLGSLARFMSRGWGKKIKKRDKCCEDATT